MRINKYKTVLSQDRICELVKEQGYNYSKACCLNSPTLIYNMLCDVFQLDKQTEEYVYLLCFDVAGKIVGVFEMFHGALNRCICNPREIFQKALICNAYGIVIAHNHTSGDVTPSQEDKKTYILIEKACNTVGMKFIDNIIIGNNDFYSFKERELL